MKGINFVMQRNEKCFATNRLHDQARLPAAVRENEPALGEDQRPDLLHEAAKRPDTLFDWRIIVISISGNQPWKNLN